MISPAARVTRAPLSLLGRALAALRGRPAVRVSGTSIYVRAEGSRQLVVYAMSLASRSDAAMILPLPVRPGTPEDEAHRFVALDGCPDLFDQLELLFAPPMQTLSKGHGLLRAQSARPRIAVTSVGSFEASYVPSVSDFDRLDPRFRLPPDVWSQLPRYQDYGFAVFKLKAGDAKVHPMALWFDTRDDQRLFFPTVHVHDGRVHAQADFDHKLYWETATPTADTSTEGAAWFEDPETEALRVPDAIKARAPSVFGDGLVRRRVMRGPFPNEDQWADATSPAPA
ncbi:MAG: hypothetical protein KC668_06780 [Myxococcales bacterium]|nr:hypothetical protein [Myxococcales bacterium]